MLESWSKWALLPLRLIIGYGFMAHGFAKLSRGPEGFAGLLTLVLGGTSPLSIDRMLERRKGASGTSYTKRNARDSRISP